MIMECNKEEGMRARDIAENKMQNKDFAGARRVALKAQQLFPDIDNISQILTVCEVHCSAGVKVSGETDWYGILQVEPTADESLIKKQYRKLALLLHPDKNKFPGAEAAFKMIGEANMILSDKGKRSLYDVKRNVRIGAPYRQPSQPSHQKNRTPYVKKQSKSANEAPNTNTCPSSISQQQFPASSATQTFWTFCPSCSMRYQYYKSLLNKALRCQNCLKPFVAYDLNAQPVPPGVNSSKSGAQTKNFSGQNAHDAVQQNNSTWKKGPQSNVDGKSTASETLSKSRVNEADSEFADNRNDGKINGGETGNVVQFEKVELKEVNRRKQAAEPSAGNSNRKRGRKMVVESSDTETSDSEVAVPEEVYCTSGEKQGANGSHLRRSSRQRQKVTYNEQESDGDVDGPSSLKRLRKGGISSNTDKCEKTLSEGDTNEVKGQGGPAVFEMKSNEEKEAHVNEPVNKKKTRQEVDRPVENEETLKCGTESSVDPNVDVISNSLPDLDNISYPDPEFYDFENNRNMNQFATDQIWALYDDLDGMPRYYARIRNVYAPNFRLRYTWLEHEPAGKAEIAWSKEGLPVACGSYRLGKTEETQDRNIFSHLMCWEKGSRRNTYDIYPRKGEVWALFKDWDISWSSDAGNTRKYQYEVVEVLSDHAEVTDVDVIHLVKIKGFVGLFMRASDNGAAQIKIPPSEILRFSHKVPSYRLKGNERDGIPEGSFELDPVALPLNYGDTFPSISLDRARQRAAKLVDGHPTHVKNLVASSTKSKALNEKNARDSLNMSADVHFGQVNRVSAMEHSQIHSIQAAASKAWRHVEMEQVAIGNQLNERDINIREADGKGTISPPNTWPSHPSSSTSYEYPESEFHDFHEERTSDKFQCGQIWALYSDIDQYPKYYGRINKIDSGNFEVHLTWLELCPVLDVEKIWLREGMPIGCGRFRAAHETVEFDSVDVFSHLVQAKQTGRKDQYDIYPRIGEVWAVYKNWQITWQQPSDLVNCAFDIVEILEQTGSGIRVLPLEKCPGRRSVFIPPSKRGSSKLMIPADEYLRFSHRIPAFKLTEENRGVFRGFWELDPASLPEDL